MNKELIFLLECLAARANTVRTDRNGNYTTEEDPEGEEYSLESRLQYELFGEYPLSACHAPTWDRIKHTLIAFHDLVFAIAESRKELEGLRERNESIFSTEDLASIDHVLDSILGDSLKNIDRLDNTRFWYTSAWDGSLCEFASLAQAEKSAERDGSSGYVTIRDKQRPDFQKKVTSLIVYP